MSQRHVLLKDFVLDYTRLGASAPLARTAVGQACIDVLMSPAAFAAVLGVIDAAPSRPIYPALDRYLLPEVGIAAADDAVKIMNGRVLRQLVEHVGGQYVRKGVVITVPCAATEGAIYTFPATVRGKMDAAGRRAWAADQVAQIERLRAIKAAKPSGGAINV